ncbi:beta-ketoacyl synthase N-terminal-like domain-containing protein [Actinomadura rubrisoli]|uniref:Ketosynthase chain-length factor n=1 Tax=Actinomadura rubrisoli TaxID=2530368 RepID=A0A4R5BRD4_9ACTN|nr:beta-ketoacyl synthase N-terminal-like domain-containing protein [Actinomadura rubrisoli]TDD88013.1 ketosynthase chain-length factor [Actinomadura rubrisoli]
MTGDVVVTGLGVTAPNGIGADEYWGASLRGEPGIGPITRFDTDGYAVGVAGEIPVCAAEQELPERLMPQSDRTTRLALVAADEALQDAAVKPGDLPEYAMGVVTASTSGGLEFGQRELQKLWGQGWEHVSAYMSFAWYYAVHTGQISIKNGMRGPGGVLASEQAGGVDTLAFARRKIRAGTAVMVAGGVDGTLCPYGLAIQAASGELSARTEPEAAYLPFDRDASGCVPGEGGAILIAESRADAEARGAPRVYGAIAGCGSAFDPEPGCADGLLRAARAALADAGVPADAVDAVFADAAGVPHLDRAEAAMLARLFGPRGVPVTAPKSMTGRLLSGGAALDIATALLSLRDGAIPPTANVDGDRVDERLDLVTGGPRHGRVGTVLVLARGRGGFASAAVLTQPPS